jgi:predicted lipid-binding transport protein (Tim44 family)
LRGGLVRPARRAAFLAILCLLLIANSAFGRAGGGHTYSGGSHSGGGGGGGGFGGGSGGDGGAIFELIFLAFRFLFLMTIDHPVVGIPIDFLLISLVIWGGYTWLNRQTGLSGAYSSQAHADATAPPVSEQAFEAIREHDPNFSQILFTDFTYALFAEVQQARGRKDLAIYEPYLSPAVINPLQQMSGPDLYAVTGVVVGASRIIAVTNPARPKIFITVEFETNYTETFGAKDGRSTAWYTREQWTFVRDRDVLSRAPDKITAIHCPKCGGALARNPDGTCQHCGVKIVGGEFDWYVTRVRILERENRGPLLTSDVPEVGTDWPTIYQPNFRAVSQRFLAMHQGFSLPKLEERVQHIFLEVQAAWTQGRWERVRPYVSDSFFQTQLFWMSEYRRQHLRNVLENVSVARIVPVKITMDAFHDALTFRIYAAMIDYTADEKGNVLSGNPRRSRPFSEYWTFIRRRGVKNNDKNDANCPNCGAPLKVNMAGVCEYCRGKITNGDFDWVLSRIEQDESYRG